MEGNEPKKLAILRIWQILREYSDFDHPLTQDQIAEYLERDYGIVIERKAIGRNISLLVDSGKDIEQTRNGCYLKVREFEDSELRLLIDSVLSSRHIPVNYSKDLIDRLCRLSNKYFRSKVKHIHSVDGWSKSDNSALFFNIELIDKAIEQGKQVQYDYNKYGADKKLHRSSYQCVSPYNMILHNQRYYLMAYSDYWGNMVFHRLDHISKIKITDKTVKPIREIDGYRNGINYKELSSAMPYMYTDKPEYIDFIADASIIDQIIDWLGTAVRISNTNDEKQVKVTVKASPTAMEYWALQYVNYVEIISPVSLRERIKADLEIGTKKYQ